jgi:hypothetical protein
MVKMNPERRQILKYGMSTVLTLPLIKVLKPLASLTALELLVSGCAHQEIKHQEIEKEPQVIYPLLKGQKIQPPENGCYIGFFTDRRVNYKEEIFGRFPTTAISLITENMIAFPK